MSSQVKSATANSDAPAAAAAAAPDNENNDYDESFALQVLQDLDKFLKENDDDNAVYNLDDFAIVDNKNNNQRNSSLFNKSATAMPVAAIKALLGVVQRSKANTMMGLQDELRMASEIMIRDSSSSSSSSSESASSVLKHRIMTRARTQFGLTSGCELLIKYVTRTFLELEDFEQCRLAILERGTRFANISLLARDRIAHVGSDFIQDGQTVLTHGWSRVVAGILLEASQTKHFDIIVLEGRPDASGVEAASFYSQHIPTSVILDSAMGYIMENVDIVLVGAEGVVENGGIVNQMGTYALAICAQANGKPFYVAAESYKFTRLYPLSQRDIPSSAVGMVPTDFYDTTSIILSSTTTKSSDSNNDNNNTKTDEKNEKEKSKEKERSSNNSSPRKIELSDEVRIINPPCDYTPAKFITLLFTDLGVLTPSAVSDELIRLYQ